jgi:hypothetical protein
MKSVQYMWNIVAEPLPTHTTAYYSRTDFNMLTILIAFYGLIFQPQYLLKSKLQTKFQLPKLNTHAIPINKATKLWIWGWHETGRNMQNRIINEICVYTDFAWISVTETQRDYIF